jgi:hypothetical protein
MKCEECNVREFVFADLYCQDCEHKPKPKIIKGRAYLFRKNKTDPIISVDVETPVGYEHEVSAIELMKNFEVEFIAEEVKP